MNVTANNLDCYPHELSPMFVCCSGDLVVHLLQGGRRSVSLDLLSSHALIISNISTRTGSVLSLCCPEGIWGDATFRIMVHNIFLPFGSYHFTIALPIFFFMLKLGIRLIVKSICKLVMISRWSEPRFVFVYQLVEVMRS